MEDAEGGDVFPFGRGFLDPVDFKLSGESLVQSDFGMGVGGLPGVWEAIQYLSRYNRPPCLRN